MKKGRWSSNAYKSYVRILKIGISKNFCFFLIYIFVIIYRPRKEHLDNRFIYYQVGFPTRLPFWRKSSSRTSTTKLSHPLAGQGRFNVKKVVPSNSVALRYEPSVGEITLVMFLFLTYGQKWKKYFKEFRPDFQTPFLVGLIFFLDLRGVIAIM